MDAALRLLSVRERSEAELRKRLRDKGFEELLVEQVLERLAETGLQDDRRFAERWAAEAAAKGKAGRLIQRELGGKGIEREMAAIAATASPEEEEARALDLARRRARSLGALEPAKRTQRIAGLLARRGFDPETCWRVAREVGGSLEEEISQEFPASTE